MAIAVALLTSGADTNAGLATTWDTASVTLTANRLYLLAVQNARGSSPAATVTAATVTGGASLTEVATVGYNSEATPIKRVTILRLMIAGTGADTIRMTFSTAPTGLVYALVEFDGVITTGTNGSGAVGTAVTDPADGATALSVTLAALASTASVAFGAIGLNTNADVTPGSGYTELTNAGYAAPSACLQTQWLVNTTTVDWTFASADGGGIGVEVKAAAVAGGHGPLTAHGRNRLVQPCM